MDRLLMVGNIHDEVEGVRPKDIIRVVAAPTQYGINHTQLITAVGTITVNGLVSEWIEIINAETIVEL